MKEIRVTFKLHMPMEIKKKGKWFIANCPIVDVCTQGTTEAQAKKNLADALMLFFMSCYERGTLDAVLRSCGFYPASSDDEAADSGSHEAGKYIDVPLPFMIDKTKQTSCHHA
ncbi:MAG: hypothetical protein WC347_05735 [Smithellaceae bacterium]|jgi:predicted RNase H-like HicB family nuclease